MEAGIVGLPFVGKTALFNALAAGHVAGGGAKAGAQANVGVVPVPDRRLQLINKYVKTNKIVPATLKVVDVPGLVRGASTGAGSGNKFLVHIRNVDALVHVVRCFEDPGVPHVDESIDPVRDVETVEAELMLADMEQVEGMLDKARRAAKGPDKEAKLRLEVLEACHKALSDIQPVRTLRFDLPDHQKQLRSMALLTAKPVLYVANVEETDTKGEKPLAQKLRNYVEQQGGAVIPVCAKLEAELAELPEADRAEMLKGMGLEEPALAVLARATLRLLGRQYFFTAGEIEIKAWTIPIGATAPQAAGAIHSDFERGFIRAEIYSVNDLDQYKTEAAIKHHGKLRVEGKNYVMQDGDITHFLFNV